MDSLVLEGMSKNDDNTNDCLSVQNIIHFRSLNET